MSAATEVERGFTLTRRFQAPREAVFRAWTDPEHLQQWFATGTASSSSHPATVDLRVGGTWRVHMVESAQRSYTTGGVYREVVAPERLVFTFGAVDGWPMIDPDRPDDGPVVTIVLHDVDGGTEMALTLAFADGLPIDRVQQWLDTGMRQGWTQTLARLDDALRPVAR